MSWADKKIMAYKNGATARFLEKRNLEHANPVLFTLLILGGSIITCGLWQHTGSAIAAGIILCFMGHIFVWTRK